MESNQTSQFYFIFNYTDAEYFYSHFYGGVLLFFYTKNYNNNKKINICLNELLKNYWKITTYSRWCIREKTIKLNV